MTWQPIDTAPRNGKKVLGHWFGNNLPFISVIWWRGHKYPENPWRNALDDSSLCGFGQCHLPKEQQTWRQGPTHWQPLPAPPGDGQ